LALGKHFLPTKLHFFTQLPTLVEASLAGQAVSSPENGKFANEVKDLAHIVEAA
jgi:hypothetical protein